MVLKGFHKGKVGLPDFGKSDVLEAPGWAVKWAAWPGQETERKGSKTRVENTNVKNGKTNFDGFFYGNCDCIFSNSIN